MHDAPVAQVQAYVVNAGGLAVTAGQDHVARFARVEPRRRFAAFLDGMFAELPRKNCWTIAEHASPARAGCSTS